MNGMKIQDQGIDQAVYMRAKLTPGNEHNSVEVDLWYSSSLDLGLKMADELAALSYSFGSEHKTKSLFTPRIATFSCIGCPEEFKQKNCVSGGEYCAYTPKFFDEYNLKDTDFEMSGRAVLIQGLREKCLHQLISNKYDSEGGLFFTFFRYLETCFTKADSKGVTVHAKSLDDCYDWSTVLINNNEEVGYINKCVEGSFVRTGEYQTENRILKQDRDWANELNIQYHPSIVINNRTYHGDAKGIELAMAICAAYKEKPDECDLSWRIKKFEDGTGTANSVKMPNQKDYIYEQSN